MTTIYCTRSDAACGVGRKIGSEANGVAYDDLSVVYRRQNLINYALEKPARIYCMFSVYQMT